MTEHHAAPPPDEPKTPMWLPALGAVLFLLAGLWWLASGSDDAAKSAAPAGSASAAPSATAAPPAGH